MLPVPFSFFFQGLLATHQTITPPSFGHHKRVLRGPFSFSALSLRIEADIESAVPFHVFSQNDAQKQRKLLSFVSDFEDLE